jgi:hypothetical protein
LRITIHLLKLSVIQARPALQMRSHAAIKKVRVKFGENKGGMYQSEERGQ